MNTFLKTAVYYYNRYASINIYGGGAAPHPQISLY